MSQRLRVVQGLFGPCGVGFKLSSCWRRVYCEFALDWFMVRFASRIPKSLNLCGRTTIDLYVAVVACMSVCVHA